MRWMGVLIAMAISVAGEEFPGAWVQMATAEKPGVLGSGEVMAPAPFTRAVISWDADVPQGSSLAVELTVGNADGWMPEQAMGRWYGGIGGSSVRTAPGGPCTVDVDTLALAEGKKADRFRYSIVVKGSAKVRLVAVATWDPADRAPFAATASPAWGRTIDVPERSQMSEDKSIAGNICSPTSVSMMLEYLGIRKPTADVAEGVFDHQARIYGNWPLNTAYAALVGARVAYVARFRGLEDLEKEIAEGRPVIISHKWKAGELSQAPVASTDGHLVVVVGFTKEGDVVINDPAAHVDKGEKVRRVYPRKEIYHTWLENGQGIAYILRK